MSLIQLINGLICLITGALFYFYINTFKDEISKSKTIMYFIFGAYFIFDGFIRIKIATIKDLLNFNDFNIYDSSHAFAILTLVAHIMFAVVMYISIKKEKECY